MHLKQGLNTPGALAPLQRVNFMLARPGFFTDKCVDVSEHGTERETYERVGLVAHALGLARHDNPYVRAAGSRYVGGADASKLRRLGEHWWRGWDSWSDKGAE